MNYTNPQKVQIDKTWFLPLSEMSIVKYNFDFMDFLRI